MKGRQKQISRYEREGKRIEAEIKDGGREGVIDKKRKRQLETTKERKGGKAGTK
jgi:hypothetical protein